MLSQDTKNKLIELFISIDDFCLALQAWQAQRQLGLTHLPKLTPELSHS